MERWMEKKSFPLLKIYLCFSEVQMLFRKKIHAPNYYKQLSYVLLGVVIFLWIDVLNQLASASSLDFNAKRRPMHLVKNVSKWWWVRFVDNIPPLTNESSTGKG
jgi:hypothetical protein